MELIQDILSTIRKGPELMGQLNASTMSQKSVARGARESTLQFPVLMSDTIPIDMASTVTRTLERTYAGFVQIWISMNQTVDLSIDPTPMSYLKKFHQNVHLESVPDDLFIEQEEVSTYMEKVYKGEYQLYMNEDCTYGLLFNMTDKNVRAMMESNKELLKEHMSDFDLRPVQVVQEADSDNSSSGDLADAIFKNELRSRKLSDDLTKSNISDKQKVTQLLDRDIKKSNDLMPFAMQVRLVGVNKDKNFVQYLDFILGIKCVMHGVRSDDMVDQLSMSLKNRDPFFKLIRYTTGELSLWRNMILNLDELKMDATATRKVGRSPWFSKLRRLKGKKLTTRNLTVPTKLIPNTTIVVSEYEVNDIKNKLGFDLRDAHVAKKLISDLFLMGFVIVDDSTNTIDVLYDDGANDFETYTLEALQREVTLTSNKLGREIGRMIQNN